MTEPKRNKHADAIVDAAKSLFWKYGIRKVTVAEICEEAGVSKMTFYRLFKNKHEAAREVMERLAVKGFQDYQAIMSQDISFPEKVTKIIENKHERAKGISREFLNDIYKHNYADLKDSLETHRQRMMEQIMQDFKRAQQQGWIRKELKLPFIMYMLNLMNEHVLDEQLVAMHDDTTDLIMELTNFFFYGISSPKKRPR